MTPQHLAEIARRAKAALKHSGKGEWSATERIVVSAIGDHVFTVATIDEDDDLPTCAGEAIALHIESSQPSVVIAMVEELVRLRSAMRTLGDAARESRDEENAEAADEVSNEARPA